MTLNEILREEEILMEGIKYFKVSKLINDSIKDFQKLKKNGKLEDVSDKTYRSDIADLREWQDKFSKIEKKYKDAKSKEEREKLKKEHKEMLSKIRYTYADLKTMSVVKKTKIALSSIVLTGAVALLVNLLKGPDMSFMDQFELERIPLNVPGYREERI